MIKNNMHKILLPEEFMIEKDYFVRVFSYPLKDWAFKFPNTLISFIPNKGYLLKYPLEWKFDIININEEKNISVEEFEKAFEELGILGESIK